MIDLELPGGFVVAGSLWFLTQAADMSPDNPADWAACLVRGGGDRGSHIPCFTDADLAVRYIDRHAAGGRMFAFEVDDPKALAMLLEATRLIPVMYGDDVTQLAFDPEGTHARYHSIADVRAVVHRGLGLDLPPHLGGPPRT